MAVLLGNKNVGDIVKINENGVPTNFIIVHKGRPSALYDSSCDGVWLLRETVLERGTSSGHGDHIHDSSDGTWDGHYPSSTAHTWLNKKYLDRFDPKIQDAIKTVKIPYSYRNNQVTPSESYTSSTIMSGSDGASCKVFLLAGYEMGYTGERFLSDEGLFDSNYLLEDGARLSYFPNNSTGAVNTAKDIGKNSSGTAVMWWLRTANARYPRCTWYVTNNGGLDNITNGSVGVTDWPWLRPAFILPTTLSVDSGGNVTTNTAPTISANKSGNLGTLTDGFDITYSVNDADGNSVTVTETFDDVQKRRYTAALNKQESFSISGEDWFKVTNGSHTFTVSATDDTDTVNHSVTFTRNYRKIVMVSSEPMEADDQIRYCSLMINGTIPVDAVMICEVTNNALDAQPVWEDCTLKTRAGLAYTFKNKIAEKGFAFSFRITMERGGSGTGGMISKIYGGFE